MSHLHHRTGHHGWDRDHEPQLEVAPGAVVELHLQDCFDGQLPPDATSADVAEVDLARANPLTGPIAVQGARPGDAIGVELLAVDVAEHGWTTIFPGFGLLADDFPDPHVVVSRVAPTGVRFGEVAELPHAPFLGTVGVAPGAPGPHSVIPPRRVGGNLDTRDVRSGATLWLPVEVDGALLSAGDPHAVQGDGEVCGTAVETSATAVVRLHLRPGEAPEMPVIELPGDGSGRTPGRRHVTTGVGPDLLEGARVATRAMIDHLVTRHGLDAADAYALCSVAADLRITEIVDAPNWVVAMDLDLDLLAGSG